MTTYPVEREHPEITFQPVRLIDGMRRHFREITQIQRDGMTIGYISQRRGDRATIAPWQAWTGRQMTTLCGSFYREPGTTWAAARDAAIAAVIGAA